MRPPRPRPRRSGPPSHGNMQGYLAHKKQRPPKDPTVDLCLGPYQSPGGGAVSYERGTPVVNLNHLVGGLCATVTLCWG